MENVADLQAKPHGSEREDDAGGDHGADQRELAKLAADFWFG